MGRTPGDRTLTPAQRVLARADVRSADECWPWGHAVSKNGYAELTIDYEKDLAHRWSYRLHVGPIPDGMHIDHACHNRDVSCPGGPCQHRRCVNPRHLVAATPAQNVLAGRGTSAQNARKTHCPRNHPLPEQRDGTGRRVCRICKNGARP